MRYDRSWTDKARAAKAAKVAMTRNPQLLAERAAGASFQALADKYDLSTTTVRRIVAKAKESPNES